MRVRAFHLIVAMGLFMSLVFSPSVFAGSGGSSFTCGSQEQLYSDTFIYKGPFETEQEAVDNCNCGITSSYITESQNSAGGNNCQVIAQDYAWDTTPPYGDLVLDATSFDQQNSTQSVSTRYFVHATCDICVPSGLDPTVLSETTDPGQCFFPHDSCSGIETDEQGNACFRDYGLQDICLDYNNDIWSCVETSDSVTVDNIACDDGVLFGGACYKVIKTNRGLTFDNAQDVCGSWGGNLASIHSASENNFVFSLAQDATCAAQNGLKYAWLGGTAVGTRYSTNRYLFHSQSWLDNSDFDYTNFVNTGTAGQPLLTSELNYLVMESTNGYGAGPGWWQYYAAETNFVASCALCKKEQQDTFELTCPYGSIELNGSCYYRQSETRSYEDAQAYCVANGGNLVSVNSAEENQFLFETYGYGAPLGGTDALQESSWQWEDGSSWQYTNWASGEPSNSGSFNDEDCIVFKQGLNGKWNDVYCNNFKWICESSSPAPLINECPDGWANFEGSCYQLQTTHKNWQGAENYCVSQGGHLASINSQAEQDFVYVTVVGSQSSESQWLGATDTATEGTFMWTDGSDFSYTNWQPGGQYAAQPDNFNDEDCVSFWYEFNGGGWGDAQCGSYMQSVCELDASSDWINAGQICQACDGAEVCDGQDNDCDGLVDNIFGSEDPLRDYDACGSSLVGACSSGYTQCIDGNWTDVCVGIVEPTAEICDELDNDCDGTVDEFTFYASSTNFSDFRCSEQANRYPYLINTTDDGSVEFVSCFDDDRLPYLLQGGVDETTFAYPDQVNGAPNSTPLPTTQRVVSYNSITVQDGDTCIIEGDFLCDPVTESWRGGEGLTSLNGLDAAIARTNFTSISLSPNHLPDAPSYSCCPNNYCWNGAINQCVRTTGVPSAESLFIIDDEAYQCADGDWINIESKPSPLQDEIGYCFEDNQCFYSWSGSPDGSGPCVNSSTQIGPYLCSEGTWVSTTQSLGAVIVQAYNDLAVDLNLNNQPEQFGLYCGDVESTLNFISESTDASGYSQLDNLRGLQDGILLCDLPQTQTVQEECVHRACTLQFDYQDGDATQINTASHRTILGVALALENSSDIYSTEFTLFKQAMSITSCDTSADDDGWITCQTTYDETDNSLSQNGEWKYNLNNGVAIYLTDEYVSWIDSVLNILEGSIIDPIFNALGLLFGDNNPTDINTEDYAFLSNGFVADTFYYGKIGEGNFLASLDASSIHVGDDTYDHSAVVLQYTPDPSSDLSAEFICNKLSQFNVGRGDIFSCDVFNGTGDLSGSAIAVGNEGAEPYWLEFTALLRPHAPTP